MRICVNTQTPLVRFKVTYPELMERYGPFTPPIRLETLVAGEDYDFSPGGVTALVYPQVLRLLERGLLEKPPTWISPGPNYPAAITPEGIELQYLQPPPQDVPRYTAFKELLWQEIHALGHPPFDAVAYEAYARYNWLCAERMLQLLNDVDLYFIHDFQQLLTGAMIGPAAPTVMRWHIPFNLEGVTPRIRDFILRSLREFDFVIVSTRRELEGLIRAGFQGRVRQIYPAVDPAKWPSASETAIAWVRDRFRMPPDGLLVAVVARMDPIKSQDVVIRAVARLRRTYPELRLLLVGNGSFTSSAEGGLAHPKGRLWRRELGKLVRELRVENVVVFTDHVDPTALQALYSAADVVVVPSRLEGFNLTTLEAWLYGKPVVASLGVGSAELVVDAANGFRVPAGDWEGLAARLEELLRDAELRQRLGTAGAETVKQCVIDRGVDALTAVFEETARVLHSPAPQAATAATG